MNMVGDPYPCTESKASRQGHLNKVHNNNYTAAASLAEFHGALAKSSSGYRNGSKESDRRSTYSGGMCGKTTDTHERMREDQLDTVQEMVSRFQDAPSFYYT